MKRPVLDLIELVIAAAVLVALVYLAAPLARAASGNQDGCNVVLYQADGRSLTLYRGSLAWAGPFDSPDGSYAFGPIPGFALPTGRYRAVWNTGAVDTFTIDCPAYSDPTPAAPAPTLPAPTLPPTDTAD